MSFQVSRLKFMLSEIWYSWSYVLINQIWILQRTFEHIPTNYKVIVSSLWMFSAKFEFTRWQYTNTQNLQNFIRLVSQTDVDEQGAKKKRWGKTFLSNFTEYNWTL